MTGSSIPHLSFPTFRPKPKAKGVSHLDPVPVKAVPPTPSFGLFLPTPIPASSNSASPYLTASPVLPTGPQPAPHFGGARSVPALGGIALQPRYQLYEPAQAHEGACGEAGWMSPVPPTPVQRRPLPYHPNPFGSDYGYTASPPPSTPPRFLPPLPPAQLGTPTQRDYQNGNYLPTPHAQPGQVLTTSSTAYCRQITDMATPTSALRRSAPPTTTRPLGPRRADAPPMRRGTSSNTSSSSGSSNTTDLRRRSAFKSLPPTRDYSSSSNKSHRTSLLAAIDRDFHSGHILSSTQALVDSPPQADFVPEMADHTLSWQPEVAEEDEAQAVWRKLEQRMGRRMNSGLEAQRGRWVVTPASPMPPPRKWEAVEMSPGQFSVSDYLLFGDEEGEDGHEVYAMGVGQAAGRGKGVPGTPYPRKEETTKPKRSSRPPAKSSALDTLDDSLFPISAPPAPARAQAQPSPPHRTTLCRLDTQVVSALEALKSDWGSPDLDFALLGAASSSPQTPTPTKPAPRPLPLPSLTRRSASPAEAHLTTPPPLPTPPSPLERGLGLGMSLGTTYNLPSKPTPMLPSRLIPSRKNTRPLPAPVQSPPRGLSRRSTVKGKGLSRRSTMRVEKVADVQGMFVIRDLDTGEALEVGVEGLEAALFEMASRA
ncbi:uncharacterized protein MKK02DRAFT_39345 [Dioszegia hungarica]|uniref:Uncharacterized protein n=1 Tax=Dioszegia hungarica TaxID=4972 RepID=A0AA38HCJ7_9TREE|nr:uncharacterized protein MKK02DRAFT_39345 [Dioszegia hungarica]KAI9639068.1 hypothetical protein MKK02DRAFT_39345 [Dioszegia hungarica]